MIKELWILVKMLFTSKPSEMVGKPLEFVTMKNFPFKKFTFMNWCGKVVLREEKRPLLDRFLKTKAGQDAQTHEQGHGRQAISMHGDNWLSYYLSYFWYWLKENPITNPASSAYYTNRYEVEAYAQEGNPEYWVNYTRDNLRGKYTLKGGKKLYKKIAGRNPAKWKEYVKSL